MQPPPVRRHESQGLLPALRLALVCLLMLLARAAPAQGVELASLRASRAEGALDLEFNARVSLPRTVEDALRRGVPLYFVADAELFRKRWYWRDERVSHISRSWRVAYQPLTGNWRVGLGGLNQTYATLNEALTSASRSASWKLADLAQLDADKNYYIEFSYRLDTSQLPGPMQFGLNGFTGQGDWAVGVSRVIKVDLGATP
ncbi:MAG: DUF4390 domain-containing protein [Burkholderiales bacterium]|nr:DUF4390 domain-containing protein [Burkholderiales bacterium]MDE2160711.1 DUF4390 domain-containing protein [Burkholderiales bacterium]MDE2503779.1 DUF4390 domain-containing protein [Burkholderiales bacterium]